MPNASAKTIVDSLDVDDIRGRLAEVAAEEAALRALLRAAVAKERARKLPVRGRHGTGTKQGSGGDGG
jgi:hypothetical protein